MPLGGCSTSAIPRSLIYKQKHSLPNMNFDSVSQISTRAQTVVERPQQTQDSLPFVEFSDEAINRVDKEQEEKEKRQRLQAELRRLTVPTQEADIKSQLRQLGQPVTYFGESPAERRDRLKRMLQDHLIQFGRLPQFMPRNTHQYTSNLENEFFMYEGSELLRAARIEIAKASLHRAAMRVERQRLRRLTVDALQEDQEVLDELELIQDFKVSMGQYADAGGVLRGALSPNEALYATAGGSGECRVWDVNDTSLKASLLGHLTKCHSVAFHPRSTLTLSPKSYANVATSSSDLMIRLHTLDLDQPPTEDLAALQKSVILKGHEDRVSKVVFLEHFLLSVSFDRTWRLWDIETQQEILAQTGHQRSIYSGSLHPDGSLFYTGDLGGFGMIWDLRTGKSVLPLTGHVKGILSSDFSNNGYHLASGGDDNFVRIWDIRRKGIIEKIPAHLKLVSDLRYQNGKYLISGSYDGTVKFWNGRDWSLSKIYESPENKVTSVHVTTNNKKMITAGLDKKFVIWE